MPEQKQYPHYFKELPKASHVDIYAVLRMWDVRCGATQHAIKKLLCAGGRGAKDRETDLLEAIASIKRAIELPHEFSKDVEDVRE